MIVIETRVTGSEQDITLLQSDIDKISKLVIETMQYGLPQEAHTIGIFNHVLENTKKSFRAYTFAIKVIVHLFLAKKKKLLLMHYLLL